MEGWYVIGMNIVTIPFYKPRAFVDVRKDSLLNDGKDEKISKAILCMIIIENESAFSIELIFVRKL